MPELPEVETIRRDLENLIQGKAIKDIRLYYDGFIKYPGKDEFVANLTGKKVRATGRRGKYLFLHLSEGFSLVVHLRMTGRILYHPQGAPPDKHTHGVFLFAGGGELHFHDVRKFGTMWLITSETLCCITGLAALGPEPLEEEFSAGGLCQQCQKTRSSIKSLLLSQKAAAGIGNIYADEALFRAGLNPERPADSLNRGEVEKLWAAIREVLQEGLKARGTSMRDYRDATGSSGSFQDFLKVYGHKGKPCPRCGCMIERKKIVGRSSHYCPACQKQA
jgi:formamidopyrimidine-DNA glycosylase